MSQVRAAALDALAAVLQVQQLMQSASHGACCGSACRRLAYVHCIFGSVSSSPAFHTQVSGSASFKTAWFAGMQASAGASQLSVGSAQSISAGLEAMVTMEKNTVVKAQALKVKELLSVRG